MSKMERTPKRYGLDPRQSVDSKRLVRDVRPLHQQVADIFVEPMVTAAFIIVLGLLALIIPGLIYFVLPLAFFVRHLCVRHPDVLPMNMPEEAGGLDFNDPKPGRTSAYESRGKVFLGNDMDEQWELWTTFNVLLRHMTYFGTTGSGKSEALLSLFANFLGFGGSCVYNDAKGTMKLVWQAYTISRFFGRDDDFMALNYITGNTSAKPDPAIKNTHDTNPFTVGSADSLTQMMMGLLPGSGPNDPNKLFSERAIGLISAMMPALVELRDKGVLLIDPGVIRRFMEFTEFVSLADNPHVSPSSKEAVYAYMASLSGFVATKAVDKQPEEVTRQFGFAQAYFTRALSSLSDTYGNIYMTQLGEINMSDVVLNNRILITVLPAMEKSDEELSNLGKINLSALKNAMSIGLGSRLEGRRSETIEALPTASNYPTGVILDELAYQAVPGIAITAAQARGLMFSMVFASQEKSSLTRVLDKEAEQLIGNTRIKVIMSLEDGGETVQLVYELVGEGRQMQTDGYRVHEDKGANYTDSMSASISSVKRIDLMDLRALNEGEAFIIYQDRIIRTSLFWHGFTDKDLVKGFTLTRRMKTRISHRGQGRIFFTADQAEAERELQIWFDNLEAGELQRENKIPKTLANTVELLQVGREKTTLPMACALAAIARYGDGPIRKDKSSDNTGKPTSKAKPLLGNLHGDAFDMGESEARALDFDHLDSTDDRVGVDSTIEEAAAMMDSILNDADRELSPDINASLAEVGHDEDQGEVPIFMRRPFVPTNDGSIEQIGEGIAHLEKKRGATDEEAQRLSKSAVKAVRQAIEYPTEPTVKRGRDFDVSEVSAIISDWINDED